MSELTFCKQYLTALTTRPIKLSSDHIADPRQLPAGGAFFLPRLPHPRHPLRPVPKPATDSSNNASTSLSTSPPSPPTLTLTLKPMKPTANTPILPLPSTNPLTTSIYDLKAAYARASSIPTTKLKILYKKKPVADTKTVAEVVGEGAGAASGEGVVEFTVMVIGGGGGGGGGGDAGAVASPPAVVPSEAEKGLGAGTGAGAAEEDAGTASTAQGPSGREVVAGAEFWDDLKGFVLQRIRDEREAERLVKVFKAAWEQER